MCNDHADANVTLFILFQLGILSDYSDIVRVAPEMAELASLQVGQAAGTLLCSSQLCSAMILGLACSVAHICIPASEEE